MEKYDALTDVIRTLARKCDDVEHYKNRAEMYERWYNEEREKNAKLREELDSRD